MIYQGHIAIDGSTKILCTTSSMTITSITITNPNSNYTFTLFKWKEGEGIHLIPIYSFFLDAGDTIIDDEQYILSESDYIQLVTDVVGTTYYINTTSE